MDDKTYHQEIVQDNPFPGEPLLVPLTSQANPAGTFSPSVSKDKTFPIKRTAVELLSTALNTRSRKILEKFDLVQSGAIQIGNFKEGLTGDLRLTPNGITARDIAGLTTFAIDGTTGDAVFKGEVQAGSLVSGKVLVGGGNIEIDGENTQLNVFDSSDNNTIRLDETGLIGFDTAETEIMHLKTTGLEVYGSAGDIFRLSDEAGGTTWGKMGYSISAGFSHSLNLYTRGVMNIRAYESSGDFAVLKGNLILNDENDFGNVILNSQNNMNVQASGTLNLIGNVVQINGSPKTAIVPTTKGYRALYTVESPDLWFCDFCYGKRKRKFPKFWEFEWEVKPDSLFLETVEPPFVVIPTGTKNLVQIWGKRKGFAKTRFEEKSKEQFEKNNEFWQKPN